MGLRKGGVPERAVMGLKLRFQATARDLANGEYRKQRPAIICCLILVILAIYGFAELVFPSVGALEDEYAEMIIRSRVQLAAARSQVQSLTKQVIQLEPKYTLALEELTSAREQLSQKDSRVQEVEASAVTKLQEAEEALRACDELSEAKDKELAERVADVKERDRMLGEERKKNSALQEQVGDLTERLGKAEASLAAVKEELTEEEQAEADLKRFMEAGLHGVVRRAQPPEGPEGDLARALESVERGGTVLTTFVTKAVVGPGAALERWHLALEHLAIDNVIVVAMDTESFQFASDTLRLPAIMMKVVEDGEDGVSLIRRSNAEKAMKYGALETMLSLGYNVLVLDPSVLALSDPLLELARDVDVEVSAMYPGQPHVAQKGQDGAEGLEVHVPAVDPAVLFLRATPASVRLAHHMRSRLVELDSSEVLLLQEAAVMPSMDARLSPGVHVRVLNPEKFTTGAAYFAAAAKVAQGRQLPHPTVIHLESDDADLTGKMMGLYLYYHMGQKDALEEWLPNTSGGAGRKAGGRARPSRGEGRGGGVRGGRAGGRAGSKGRAKAREEWDEPDLEDDWM
ncbi:unnamed protein product [Pedinophyceae sp. YPF-701]|nr:unnamed protein product [Pedinophyceae sp. YPF-701]